MEKLNCHQSNAKLINSFLWYGHSEKGLFLLELTFIC